MSSHLVITSFPNVEIVTLPFAKVALFLVCNSNSQGQGSLNV